MILSLVLSFAAVMGGAQDISTAKPNPITSEVIVQKQVDAYNAHDIDLFSSFYDENILLYNISSGRPIGSGLDSLKTGYGQLFKNFPKLKITIESRIVQGEFIIDKEKIEGMTNPVVYGTAVYQVKEGKITKVWFLH